MKQIQTKLTDEERTDTIYQQSSRTLPLLTRLLSSTLYKTTAIGLYGKPFNAVPVGGVQASE